MQQRTAPPGPRRFGFESLCESYQAPVEGVDFELTDSPTAPEMSDETVSVCQSCRDQDLWSEGSCDEILYWGRHEVCVDRTVEGYVDRARVACNGVLDWMMEFELPDLEGDLHDFAESVCKECWSAYYDQEWNQGHNQTEIPVSVIDNDREMFFASEIKGLHDNVTIVSQNGLEERFELREIAAIGNPLHQRVDY